MLLHVYLILTSHRVRSPFSSAQPPSTPCMGLDLGFRIFLNLSIFEPPHGPGNTHLLDGCGISDLWRNDKLLFAPYKASQDLSKSKIPNPRALMLA